MMNIRPFQIVLLGSFAVLALIGVIFFMFYQGSSGNQAPQYGARVMIWGTLEGSAVNRVIDAVQRDNDDFSVVTYVQKDERTFDTELLNAIAEGRSPDLVVLASDSIVQHRAKLFAFPYDTISQRDFRDTYVDGAEIYQLGEGTYGIPFVVDPLVMYWNRDLFASSGLATPPTTWQELTNVTAPAITTVSNDRQVVRSGVALGEYGNIQNAKHILALLFLQSGTDIVVERENGYGITLQQGSTAALPPAQAALSFYTQFSLPSAVQYSWSRSLPLDRLEFTSGDLALYFGYGSEYRTISNANPNLNFDLTMVPQGSDASVRRGVGQFYAFAVPRAAANAQGAFAAAQTLSSASVADMLASELDMAPARRTLVGAGADDPYRQVLYRSALIARGWLDPSPTESANIFRTMIEDVTSGRQRVSQAVNDAVKRLELLF